MGQVGRRYRTLDATVFFLQITGLKTAMVVPTSSATLHIDQEPALLGDTEGNKRPRKAVLLVQRPRSSRSLVG